LIRLERSRAAPKAGSEATLPAHGKRLSAGRRRGRSGAGKVGVVSLPHSPKEPALGHRSQPPLKGDAGLRHGAGRDQHARKGVSVTVPVRRCRSHQASSQCPLARRLTAMRAGPTTGGAAAPAMGRRGADARSGISRGQRGIDLGGAPRSCPLRAQIGQERPLPSIPKADIERTALRSGKCRIDAAKKRPARW
jgi:hypothetical protein